MGQNWPPEPSERFERSFLDNGSAAPLGVRPSVRSELEPVLLQNGSVQCRPSPRVAINASNTATGRPRHVSDLEFLKTHDSVILADLCRDLVNAIQTLVGDTRVNLLHSAPGLLPVLPEPAPPALTTLGPPQRLDELRIGTGQLNDSFVAAVGERRETCYAEVYSHGAATGCARLKIALRLNADEPPPALAPNGHCADYTLDRAAQANTGPADPRWKDSRVLRFELATLRQAKAVVSSALLETRLAGAAGGEIAEGPIEIL